jgi:hypothetical protein
MVDDTLVTSSCSICTIWLFLGNGKSKSISAANIIVNHIIRSNILATRISKDYSNYRIWINSLTYVGDLYADKSFKVLQIYSMSIKKSIQTDLGFWWHIERRGLHTQPTRTNMKEQLLR